MEKPTFKDLFDKHHCRFSILAQEARTSQGVVVRMFQNQPVYKQEAESVLRVLSTQTGINYTLDTVNVPIKENTPPRAEPANKPFFRELYDKHKFAVGELVLNAKVHDTTVLAMLRAVPVWRMQAEKVLQALSELTKENYTLDTVRVPLIPESGEKRRAD